MNRNHVIATAALLSIVIPASPCHAQSGGDWPFYRHDLQLTGRSPAIGDMRDAPVQRWKYYLGGWTNEFSVTFAASTTEKVPLRSEDPARSNAIWNPPKRVDLEGTGTLVPAPPGKVAKLMLGVKGLQQVVWEHPPDKPTAGVGRCYAFDAGAEQPRLVWQTEEVPEVYELLWTIADMDGDALPEVVFMTHYRVLVYDGQTGAKKSTLKWPIGRNYGQMTLADVDGDRLPEVVVVVDSPPHVDVLKYAPQQGKVLWSHRYVTDAQVSLPIELKLRLIPNHVQDVDGDGRLEIIYNLFNAEGDFRWHLVIRDARSGDIKYDLPGTFLWGIVDLDAPTKALCCLDAVGRGLPEMGSAKLVAWKDGAWVTLWTGRRVRWQVGPYDWPLTEFTIASLGPVAQAVPRVLDVDGDGRNEVFVVRDDRVVEALGTDGNASVAKKWSVSGPRDARLSVEGTSTERRAALLNVDAASGELALHNCRAVPHRQGLRNSFAPLPARPLATISDVDGDGANEVVVQDAQWQTRVLRGELRGQPPREVSRVHGGGLWLGRRWAGFPYSKFPVFTFDLDNDGKRELLLTDVEDEGVSTVTCRGALGNMFWSRPLPNTPAQSVVWMAAGRFVDPNRYDLFVVVQSGAIGSCFCLRGDNGDVLWTMSELALAGGTPFNFGSHFPGIAVADFDADGLDDLCGQSGQYVALVRGKDGTPMVTPRSMIHDLFPRWVNYGIGVVGDWDLTGQPAMFTNTTTNGFGLIDARLNVRWFTDRSGEPLAQIGSVGRAHQDGPWVFGTFVGGAFVTFDMATGRQIFSETIGDGLLATTSQVISADIDGDGSDEFLVAANNLLLCAGADARAGSRLQWKVVLPTVPSELAVADADNDGRPEIVFTGTDGYLYCLGTRQQ